MSVTCDRSVFSPISSTNKTDHHDITEILLKVALNTTTLFWSTCIFFTFFYYEHMFICLEFVYMLLYTCTFRFAYRHFNNISAISWQSVLLVEETGWPGENHWPVASHWQTLSHNVVHPTLIEIHTHNFTGDRHWLHR